MFRRFLLLPLLLLSTIPNAFAGGFEYVDQGVQGVGRGGAFTAKADDLSAMHYNPAGLANIKGLNVYYSHNFVNLQLDYTRANAVTYEVNPIHPSDPSQDTVREIAFSRSASNEQGWFLPGAMFAASYDFGLDLFTFGFGIFGPPSAGAMDFPLQEESSTEDGVNPAKYMLVNRDVVMLFYTLSMAFRLPNGRFAVGVDLQVHSMPWLRFDMMVDGTETGKVYPVNSSWDIKSRMDVTDSYNFTGIVGLWARPWDFLEIGLSSRPAPIQIEGKGKLNIDLWGDAFDSYTGDQWGMSDDGSTFGTHSTDATVSFTLPPWIRTGVRYIYGDPDDEIFDIELDFVYEFWSVFDEIKVDMQSTMNLGEPLNKKVNLGPINIRKDFEDSWSLRLGGDWQALDDLLWLRAGGFYEKGASPNEMTAVDFDALDRWGLSLGASVQVYEGIKLHVAYMHTEQLERDVSLDEAAVYQQRPGSLCQAPYTDESVCNAHYLGVEGPAINAGNYQSRMDLVSIGVNASF